MGRLRYFVMASLDGYIADQEGNFDWAEPDDEVHAHVNARLRDVGTYLYGRRMWDTMRFWETVPDTAQTPPVARDFATIWRAADKIVYSRTLETVDAPRVRLVRDFEPIEVRELAAATDADLEIGGPGLAAHALRAGLVDDIEFLAVPVLIGGGKHWLPAGVRLDLQLVEERRFRNGAVDLRYRVRR